ncbi:unnamed protein product [Caenorhabditis auriculariae]|uniref:Uncharacterized protein n=1 Tax=Caenorhabditis auriculariae TaxID=2777116 RepID=A0A8S1GMB1_9PELO|nr:unnamed protein product [Caenorhabditis auriculariae]
MAATAVSSTPTSPIGKEKRVSFGDDHTFVYEKDDDATPIIAKHFTDPDAPVSRVVVTTETVVPEAPSPIPPPAQFEEIRRVAVSPPLPTKKMTDAENPFRPEEVLYHEVDPIVEQYLHKPFPPSRPGSAQNTPTKHSNAIVNESPIYLQNGLSKEQLLHNEKTSQQEPLLPRDNHHSSPDKRVDGGDYTDELPPAGKVELIHMKKKKCGCCSVQ